MKNRVIPYVQLLLCSLVFMQTAHAATPEDVVTNLTTLQNKLGTTATGLLGNLTQLKTSLQTLTDAANSISTSNEKYKKYLDMKTSSQNPMVIASNEKEIIAKMRKDGLTSEEDSLAVFGRPNAFVVTGRKPRTDEPLFPLTPTDNNETVFEYFKREYVDEQDKTKLLPIFKNQITALTYVYSFEPSSTKFNCKDYTDFIKKIESMLNNPTDSQNNIIIKGLNKNPTSPFIIFTKKITLLLTEELKRMTSDLFKAKKSEMTTRINTICKEDDDESDNEDDDF